MSIEKQKSSLDINRRTFLGKLSLLAGGIISSVSLATASTLDKNYDFGIAMTILTNTYNALISGDESKRKQLIEIIKIIEDNGGSRYSIYDKARMEVGLGTFYTK